MVSLALVAGCQVIGGYEDFSETHGASNAIPHPCDDLPTRRDGEAGRGAQVLIKAEDGSCFWIDETEVTVGAYDSFLKQAPASPFPVDSKACDWKAAKPRSEQLSEPHLDASDECAIEASAVDSEPFRVNKPMRCVDWCDARAYCNWAGRELCTILPSDSGYTGSVGKQWEVACATGRPFPYGPTLVHRACNIGLTFLECNMVSSADACKVADVKHFSGCTYPGGPFDMIGNVAEWVLPCRGDDGPGGYCVYRGGSFEDDDEKIACNVPSQLALRRDTRSPTLGFRCCETGRPPPLQ